MDKTSEELYYKFRTLWTEKYYSKVGDPGFHESTAMLGQRYGQAFINFCSKNGVSISNIGLFNETDDSKSHMMIFDYVDWKEK